jgi:hypothetical protein
MEHFPNTYLINKNGPVFKTEVSTLNPDAALRTLREMGPR